MPTRLIEYPLTTGGTVVVEVEERDEGRLVAAGDAPERAARSFEATLATLRPVADAVMAQVVALAEVPEEVSVEFAVTFKAEAGLVIAKTAVDGQIKLSLKWKKS
jgi:hypothetical protein